MADLLTTADATEVLFEAEIERGLQWLGAPSRTVPASEALALKQSAEADGLVVQPSGI
jgi:hypothetical protein